MRRYWAEYTSKEFAQMDTSHLIAVLPIGAIEQHGPHLPVGVDTMIANEVVRRLVGALPHDIPVLFLPTQPVGKSDEHGRYPGTLTLSADTLSSLWREIGAGVARTGVRKIVLLNSHGGQISVMDSVARALRIDHDMLAFAVNWFGVGMPEDVYSAHELTHGIHAGDMETSVMLAAHRHLVVMQEAEDFEPSTVALAEKSSRIGLAKGAKFGWQAQDLHPKGACGNAALATAQKGEETLEFAVAQLVEIFKDIHAMPLDFLTNAPAWQTPEGGNSCR